LPSQRSSKPNPPRVVKPAPILPPIDKIDLIRRFAIYELLTASDNHAPLNSYHEAYGVLAEEVDELWDEIKKKRKDRDHVKIFCEAIQVAAVAMRLIHDLVPTPTLRFIAERQAETGGKS
jgi:hypothetical protein